jgi:hypothetical protein
MIARRPHINVRHDLQIETTESLDELIFNRNSIRARNALSFRVRVRLLCKPGLQKLVPGHAVHERLHVVPLQPFKTDYEEATDERFTQVFIFT